MNVPANSYRELKASIDSKDFYWEFFFLQTISSQPKTNTQRNKKPDAKLSWLQSYIWVIDKNKQKVYQEQKEMREEIIDYVGSCSIFDLQEVYKIIKRLKDRKWIN